MAVDRINEVASLRGSLMTVWSFPGKNIGRNNEVAV